MVLAFNGCGRLSPLCGDDVAVTIAGLRFRTTHDVNP